MSRQQDNVQVIAIDGPSGAGKSTMIRCINRLEEHQAGRIQVEGTELTDDLKKIDEVRREVGMVFQDFNLFPHMSVLQNLTFAPVWVRKIPKKEAEELYQVREVLEVGFVGQAIRKMTDKKLQKVERCKLAYENLTSAALPERCLFSILTFTWRSWR